MVNLIVIVIIPKKEKKKSIECRAAAVWRKDRKDRKSGKRPQKGYRKSNSQQVTTEVCRLASLTLLLPSKIHLRSEVTTVRQVRDYKIKRNTEVLEKSIT